MSKRAGQWLWAALYALPGLLMFRLVHLMFWPAQMSPDSLDQWNQIVTGSFNDTHTVPSTLFDLAFYLISPTLPWVVFGQYSVFAAATAYFLTELERWGAQRWVLLLAACALALFLPTALIVTTLWKDVPYCAALVLLTALTLRLVRLDFRLTVGGWAAIAAAASAVVLMRHNGIIVSVLYFAALAVFVRPARVPAVLSLITQLTVFALWKTVLLSVLGASPQSADFRAIVTLPVLSAMVKADRVDGEDLALLHRIAPDDAWREHPCSNVVGFFFDDPRMNRAEYRRASPRLYGLAARLALQNIDVAIPQFLCMGGIVLRPWAHPGEWIAVTPTEITEHPFATKHGIREDPRVGGADVIRRMHEDWWGKSAFWNRPASYVLAGLFALGLLVYFVDRRLWLAGLPMVLNGASLVLLLQSQEYRFMWPSVALALLLVIACGTLLLARLRAARHDNPVGAVALQLGPGAGSGRQNGRTGGASRFGHDIR